MLKAVLITLSLIIGCFTTIFFTRYIEYKICLKQLKTLENKTTSNYTLLYQDGSPSFANYNQSHPVIKSLTKLIEIPLIGQFFMDQKVYELAKIQHWTGIVNQIDHIISKPANKHNFAVWFHKALAECNLGMLDRCEQSAKTAELISGNRQQRKYSAWFYEELKELRMGKLPTSYTEILDI